MESSERGLNFKDTDRVGKDESVGAGGALHCLENVMLRALVLSFAVMHNLPSTSKGGIHSQEVQPAAVFIRDQQRRLCFLTVSVEDDSQLI